MGFTRAQQGKYRPLVESAWQRHAAENNIDPKSAPARKAWYEAQLLLCVGYSSTVACDKGRDFDCAIAHFENLADNGETGWQRRAEIGDLRRILYSVFPKNEKPEIDGRKIDAAYCVAIAEQMFQRPLPGGLRTLTKSDITAIIRRLIIFKRRNSAV